MFGNDMLSGLMGGFDLSKIAPMIEQGKAFLPMVKASMEAKEEEGEQLVYMGSFGENGKGELVPIVREVILKTIEVDGKQYAVVDRILKQHNIFDLLAMATGEADNNG